MKKTLWAAVLCAAVLLAGCVKSSSATVQGQAASGATVPADGNGQDVTCKGSYTGADDMDAAVARVGDAVLTNEKLQIWYWAEVNQYRQDQRTPAPDFDMALDIQPCPLDSSVASWQQYFLKAALNRWHMAQALTSHARDVALPTEDAYTGDPEILEDYMGEMPASKLLYGYDPYYKPNTLHQNYLDSLEQRYTGAELEMARCVNYAYMYFTTLTYNLEVPEEVGTERTSDRVSFRHILLTPGEGESREDCLTRAVSLLEEWAKGRNAGADTFAQLASRHSQDPASAKSGGLYRNLRWEQLPEELACWCFAEERLEGDTAVVVTDFGVHILYFQSWEDPAAKQAAREMEAQKELLCRIREQYPLEAEYGDMVLEERTTGLSVSDMLYPDVAHERFPEVPLYLQQDYFHTLYGEYWIRTNGCGITSLAMLASYMADDELTPPEMCARYGRYSRPTGTAGSLFEEAPPQLGFYLLTKSYDWREARDYMEEGYPVIVVQHKGYWTSGGHYLVLEKLTEDGMVQVRDSNMFNYRKLLRHKDDKFPWDTLQSGGKCYWIYEKKVTANPACTRCGEPEMLEKRIVSDYLCEKCETAMVRRNSYLTLQ
ncbi:MAG: peptidylprolyl isomerase [Oscillospiraceae bacterium]|nr:peptidylprolyl isomerase [Oscillospiraceae bacterium]